MDSKTLVALALLDALGAEQGLLTYFADLCGPAWLYTPPLCNSKYVSPPLCNSKLCLPPPVQFKLPVFWRKFCLGYVQFSDCGLCRL